VTSIEKLDLLLHKVEKKLEQKNSTNSTLTNTLREDNFKRIFTLYEKLEIAKKHDNFETLFEYKAMNLSGIGLKNDDFGEIRPGKYVQIITITYDTNKNGKRVAKNSSLGYYGKTEKLEAQLKNDIIEFVLRWRYEKSFRQSEHYQHLISKLQ